MNPLYGGGRGPPLVAGRPRRPVFTPQQSGSSPGKPLFPSVAASGVVNFLAISGDLALVSQLRCSVSMVDGAFVPVWLFFLITSLK